MDLKSVAFVDAASGKSGATVASVVDGQAIAKRPSGILEKVGLAGRRLNKKISLIWTPPHTSVPGNEAAHELARDLYSRVIVEPPDCQDMDERLQSYTEIAEDYRQLRRVVPPPDKSLKNREAVAWRRLQAGSSVNPGLNPIKIVERPGKHCCGARTPLHSNKPSAWRKKPRGVKTSSPASNRGGAGPRHLGLCAGDGE
ncbi:hypothetical protein HPB50_007173 [Hyalomma asiaticum]|uniref:Uncharacterized protein n=1 Tax=Hyalomma asiaticum TaxID=266040 RepID=A0ACB7SF49_HYAAI|nr:hypothetical protein HPB50_007173 [Hyalomma asiaticum]